MEAPLVRIKLPHLTNFSDSRRAAYESPTASTFTTWVVSPVLLHYRGSHERPSQESPQKK